MIEKKDESEPKSLNKENINLNKNQINSDDKKEVKRFENSVKCKSKNFFDNLSSSCQLNDEKANKISSNKKPETIKEEVDRKISKSKKNVFVRCVDDD